MAKQSQEDARVLDSPEGNERVLISKRPDGSYTYQMQSRSADIQFAATEEDGWGPPGPACGYYDSADTAESEARQRVPWLKRLFH